MKASDRFRAASVEGSGMLHVWRPVSRPSSGVQEFVRGVR